MIRKTVILLLVCLFMIAAEGFGEEVQEGMIKMPGISYIRQYEIPENEAMAFLKKLGTGWNLGNTFDATAGGRVGDEMAIEWTWCRVKTTPEIIRAVHDAGFDTLRIPVSWHNHVSGDDFVISAQWLDRVQEVVDDALDCGMHVILNTHHDVDASFYYPDDAHAQRSDRYISSIWTQLSERFAAYDERLIFESMNEPRLKDTPLEWVFDPQNAKSQEAAKAINRLNQVFVDTVRASGGNNAQRYLMVPGYAASVDGATNPFFALPQDSADNRIIVSVHAYTPYSFALEAGGTDRFSVTDVGQSSEITRFMNKLYHTYIEQGIPVVIGEFGARNKQDNLQARVDFAALYTATAAARNIPCCWWDNNEHQGSGELFGLLDRASCTWTYPQIPQALAQYGGYDKIAPKE